MLKSEWSRIDASALASQVAYSLIFAIPSLLLFLMAIAAIIDQRTGIPVANWLRMQINRNAPDEVNDLLIAIVDEAVSRVSGGFASASAVIALLIAVWGASGGINALMNACNRAYGVPDTRSFVQKRVLAILLTGIFAVFVVSTAMLFIGGGMLERSIADHWAIADGRGVWWSAVRWPLTAVPVAIALVLLYSIGSVTHPPLRWTLPGALISAVTWLAVLWLFGYILTVIRPGSPYGVAGSVLVLLFFLYTTGIVFILGAAFNGVYVRHFRPSD